MIVITLLCLVSMTLCCNNSLTYLEHYGYMHGGALTEDVEVSVKLFQETYGLTVDGKLNNETLDLMGRPRCGNKDDLLPFTANIQNKWSHNNITWYMYSNQQYNKIVQAAFDLWAKYANINFKREKVNPTIMISFADTKHMFYANQQACSYDFDGPGNVLAHAYIPHPSLNQTDIHMDISEDWDFTMNVTLKSFYHVLVHEIGHALGLSHSYANTSAMFALAKTPYGITTMYEYDLDIDDIRAIQFLYGRRTTPVTTSTTIPTTITSTTIPTTTTTNTPSTTMRTTQPSTEELKHVDICRLRHFIKTFLVVKDNLYAFYNDYVWVINIDQVRRLPEELTGPKILRHWLPFLPRREVSAVYQKLNGEIAIYVGDEVYYIEFPSLRYMGKENVSSLIGRQFRKINAAFVSNLGKTYIFIDDHYVFEHFDCSNRGVLLGAVTSTFRGVPNKLRGGFRYTNGRLYFITDRTILEYDEYTETVTKSESDIFDVLNISCIRETLITKLHNVLKYMQ